MTEEITKEELQQAIHNHLTDCGFSKNDDGFYFAGKLNKQKIRDLHSLNRNEKLHKVQHLIEKRGAELLNHFATGSEIDPVAIDPELTEVKAETTDSDLFRFATLLWSVPVSHGYGRRMRFLVRDRQNGKLIGIFALGDPVFNLSARDDFIGWTARDRQERLVHVMDAYVIGAVPPYSQLICGKLVAALISCQEVMEVYKRKYIGQTSVIRGLVRNAQLALLTTTSALGRSSLYNRLVIPGGPSFIRIGTTKGFGHFHLDGSVFGLMRRYLDQYDHPYVSGYKFGMGPNWRLRVARAALRATGFNADDVLKHGIEREVYAIPVSSNWKEVLLGRECTSSEHFGHYFDLNKERFHGFRMSFLRHQGVYHPVG